MPLTGCCGPVRSQADDRNRPRTPLKGSRTVRTADPPRLPTTALLVPTASLVTVGQVESLPAGWRIVETYVAGKWPAPGRCEDVLLVTEHLAAVIDGATDKSGLWYHHEGERVTSGRFAALVAAEALRRVDPQVPAPAAAAAISRDLDAALAAQRPGITSPQRPSASVMVLNAARNQLWWVGDTRAAIRRRDRSVIELVTTKRVDEVATKMRCAYLAALAAAGQAWDPQQPTPDPGRAAILPFLEIQGALANTTGPYGYGVINGLPVPDTHVGTLDLADVVEVVLASDGYPRLSLDGQLRREVAESHLAALLERDPSCVGPLAGTKAHLSGCRSFDDRAWLHLVRCDDQGG